MDAFFMLLAMGGFGFAWYKVVKTLNSSSWLIRHVAGAASGFGVFFIVVVLSVIVDSENKNQQQTAEQLKKEAPKAKFKYENMLLSEYKNKSKGSREDIAENFVKANGLPESAERPFHVCLSDMGKNKLESLTVGKIAEWCLTDYKNNPALLTRMYVDYDNFEKQFGAWDGSHYQLVALIKNNMNNPDSYQHDRTTYRLVVTDEERYAVITTSFRGQNAFGGVIKNTVVAKTDIDTGNIIEILEQN